MAGGPGRPEELTRGHCARPTIFAEVTPVMTVWREKVLGPALSIAPFDMEAMAAALPDETDRGLAAYVQTGDPVRARRVARGIAAARRPHDHPPVTPP